MVQRKPYPLYGLRKYTFFMFGKLSVKNVRIVSGIGKWIWRNIKEKKMPLGDAIKEN